MKLVYILLVLAFLKAIILYKVYHSLPVLELKRRARQGDKKAARLYKVASYEDTLDLLIWLAAVASGAVLIIWSAATKWWLAAIIIVVGGWLVVWSQFSADGWAGTALAFFAPAHAKFLSLIQPVVGRIASVMPASLTDTSHTRIYEKKDLLDFLTRQNRQLDNRIPASDLQIARNAMAFADKTVGSIMTPRKDIKFVEQNESVGPILVDELHKTGFSRFPVVKNSAKASTPQVVGTLYLNNLIGYDGNGKVKDLMRPEVYFINEDANLSQALDGFLHTHHHLLIVVNSFEEMVGMLSLEDLLEQIIGKQVVDEFDEYDSPRAVAKETKQQTQKHDEIPVAPGAE
jgi:CBS domain containing-hemolysin-like protein